MNQPKLLDLYCGQGGAAQGYSNAGFHITGVDQVHQTRFPFSFIQTDSRSYLADHWQEYDAIHLSPPCQKYSQANNFHKTATDDELEKVLPMLSQINIPFVVENVQLAPMPITIILTGIMFSLGVIRKRIFYSNVLLLQPHTPPQKRKCLPAQQIFTVAGEGGKGNTVTNWSKAMGINWMTRNGLKEAIPPAYTEYIGSQLMTYLVNTKNDSL